MLSGRLFNAIERIYLASVNWFDALFVDSVLEYEALLVEPNGDWLFAGYRN